jgi:heparinase II/III-like protein
MILLGNDEQLRARREVAAGPLAGLAESLAADLEPLLSRNLYFPADKALLSRDGGRCPRDGTLLDFDPFVPREHRCISCGETCRGDAHDRFWIYWYQLWLAERAVHAAMLAAMGHGRFAPLAHAILDGYAARYDSYPNVDNVLGPTRLFFSTYIESIWLLQICIATDLLDAAQPALAARVRDRIIAPSRAIIAEYDEGASNRQVWNDVALLAAARLLGDEHGCERAVYGPSGIASHLSGGLLTDGTWYEGENYHLFAHRGLWYGVTMAEHAGLHLPAELLDRFQLGFATPFATALPDFTLPSRRDSQYAISLRQWRIAEHCELGLAREESPALLGALHRMYCDDVPRRDTGRSRSSADVERNSAPSALSRADLSWRALLCARPTLPPLEDVPPQSALLPAQGIAVFRRDTGRAYVALDYGHPGGGHGHPDRLNLLLAHDETRWLDDVGTGSYVDRSLHWYRSTLAHNAPLFDGKSQRSVSGQLLAYDERGAAGWVSASANGLAPSASAARTLVVMPGYAIDIVAWNADHDVAVDLPLHADLSVVSGAGRETSAVLAGGTGEEDGFEFAHDAQRRVARGEAIVYAHAGNETQSLTLWAVSSTDCEWWRAAAPGPPGDAERWFWLLRARGRVGAHRLVWSWSGDVAAVEFGETIRVSLVDGTVHEHKRESSGWHIDLLAGGARSSIDLWSNAGEATEATAPDHAVDVLPLVLDRSGRSLLVPLGENEYRRSEQSWQDAGRPSANVRMAWAGDALRVDVDVPRSELTFAPSTAVNRLDNEHADINGDSVQLYLRTSSGLCGWMLVPEPGGEVVRMRRLDGWLAEQPIRARWHAFGAGYRLSIELPSPTPPLAIDVIVNEMPKQRVRRRGQLVMSGARGEFVYLRGDRHEADRLIPLRISDG